MRLRSPTAYEYRNLIGIAQVFVLCLIGSTRTLQHVYPVNDLVRAERRLLIRQLTFVDVWVQTAANSHQGDQLRAGPNDSGTKALSSKARISCRGTMRQCIWIVEPRGHTDRSLRPSARPLLRVAEASHCFLLMKDGKGVYRSV